MALIAHYRMDGDAKDSAGDLHGDILGTLTSVDGKIGKCFLFENNPNGISIPDPFKMNDFTFSVWVRPDGPHRNYNGAILSSGNWNAAHWSFSLRQDNKAIVLRAPGRTIGFSFTEGVFYHVVLSRKGTVFKSYVDSTLIDEFASVLYSPLNSDASNTTIGRETYGGGHFAFNGLIDDVRIYDHALSEREIRDLSLGLVAHYKLDGDFTNSNKEGEYATPVDEIEFTSDSLNKCATFDGNKRGASISQITSPIVTLSFKYKRDDLKESARKTPFDTGSARQLTLFSITKYLGIWDSQSSTFKSSNILPPDDGNFHQYVIVIKGNGTIEYYFDGVYVSTILSDMSPANSPIVGIGGSILNTGYSAGHLCDVRVYSTALTDEQIKELYQQQASIDSHGSVYSNRITEYDPSVIPNGIPEKFKISQNGVSVSGMSEIGPSKGLIAWYPLTNNARDYAGSFDGVSSGAIPSEDGFYFDGTSVITLPSNLGYTDRVSAFGWFKPTGVPGSGYHILFGGSEFEISIPANLSFIRSGFFVGGVRTTFNHPAVLVQGTWYHLGISFTGTEIITYLDGVQIGSRPCTGALVLSFARTIGKWSQYSMNGYIKDVRIYNRAVSDKEVGILHNITNPQSVQRIILTEDTLYTKGQFKEVIS